MDGALCFARPIIPCRKPAQFDFTTYLVGADALIGPYKFYRTFPTSIHRKSRARLWSIEGVRGNHSKGFPGLFFLLPGVFFLEKQKENAVRFPFFRKNGKNGFEKFVFLLKEKPKWER